MAVTMLERHARERQPRIRSFPLQAATYVINHSSRTSSSPPPLPPPPTHIRSPPPPPQYFPSLHLFSTSTCSNRHTPAHTHTKEAPHPHAQATTTHAHSQLLLAQTQSPGQTQQRNYRPPPPAHSEGKILPAARARVTYSGPQQITSGHRTPLPGEPLGPLTRERGRSDGAAQG